MCELLGFTAKDPTDIRPHLRAFFAHSVRNPHGWGLMREQGGTELFREPVCAAQSTVLDGIINSTEPLTTLLGHIRFATVGSIRPENCHPFSGRDRMGRTWTLIHNGTIYSGRTMIRLAGQQRGDTDSERLFLYLMQRVNEQQGSAPLSAASRFALVEQFIIETAPRNKLNLMIYDGELLYIHKNMPGTLYWHRLGSGCLFATVPLDNGPWDPFPTAQVIAMRAGRMAFTGSQHNGIFKPALEGITTADAMNI